MRKLIIYTAAGIIGLYLAVLAGKSPSIGFIYGIEYSGPVRTIIITGAFLGLTFLIVKPILQLISLPIRILTFNLFSLIIDMFLVWIIVDIFSPIEIIGIIPLFWTTIIILITNLTFNLIVKT
ncbi:MAG TPA: hypothetical protein ENL27_00785 [Candidatus Parcubacteria bacterium]|nr:hypothetical protein [Candidatus Parcubacteria bacterium]